MLFAAFLAWDLGSSAAGEPKTIGALAWVFATVQLACFVLSVLYFFLVPVLFSAAVVVCLVWAALLVSRARA